MHMMISFFIACSEGYFGENCNSSCGHCLNETACHHINGTCDDECDPGYQAPYCKDGKIYSFLYAKHILKLYFYSFQLRLFVHHKFY